MKQLLRTNTYTDAEQTCMHTLAHTLLRAHAHKLTLVLCLGVTQHLILCAFTPLLWPYNATSGSRPATNTLASCHTWRVSMSRVQLKGPYHQSSLSPLCDAAVSPFPPCALIIVSLSLSAALVPGALCKKRCTLDPPSVRLSCPSLLDHLTPPLILKEHHQLMHPLHKRTDTHLDCVNTARWGFH